MPLSAVVAMSVSLPRGPFVRFLCIYILVGLLCRLVTGQQCYYPNGDVTPVDAPCPNSDLCCPLQWECLSNGLCYDATNDYYERRTCADSTWKSEECPNFCTYSEAGNEAILLCDSGKYCCDGNRVSFDCCNLTTPPGGGFFDLSDGSIVGTITSMGPAPTSSSSPSSSSSSRLPCGADVQRGCEDDETSTSFDFASAASATGTSSTFSTATPDASTTPEAPNAPESPTTIGQSQQFTPSHPSPTSSFSSTASASNATAAGIPTSQADTHSNDHASSSFGVGAIAGLAIGILVLIALCALLCFFLYRRHKKSKIPALATYSNAPSSPTEIKYSDALPPGTRAPELDSSPKAPTDGASELYGSDTTHARNSTVSSMTAGAQGYSPTSMVSPAVSVGGGAAGRMGQIVEKDEPPPVELWGGPVYRPYRPGMQNGSQVQGGYGNTQPYSGT